MKMPLAERKMIENEMLFRQGNEKIGDGLVDLDAMHLEDDNPHLVWDSATILNFKCECSDENCQDRIALTLGHYQQIHENRKAFIIKPKHQVKEIEEVIQSFTDYSVVQKNRTVAEPRGKLNITPVDNTSE